MEYNIGNKVIVNEQPTNLLDRKNGDLTCWTQRKQDTIGKAGIITDKMFSEEINLFVYRIRFEGQYRTASSFYTADEISHYVEQKPQPHKNESDWVVETEVLSNVCVARIYRMEDGEKKEISRGHGHIIHEGDLGIVQAFSYAFKKAYEKINEGKVGGYFND